MSRNQNRKGGSKRARPDEWKADVRDAGSLHNKAFDAFYKDNVIPAREWAAFMSCLQKSLPMAVRFNRAVPQVAAVDDFVSRHLSEDFESRRLPFFPDQRAIQFAVSRGVLKRKAGHKTSKKIIAAMNEGGYLTRQETVSMLSPLALQVAPGMTVLDMCAAPGSKTSQILESLLAGDSERGVVVANDVNASRLDVLNHQTGRAPGAHTHLIITNTDATRFPLLPVAERFDRVLCDVMCSGDGTLRKSVDMWPRWSTLQGANLHHAQSRVLQRGMASCKPGGIVVYSTCSLNPVEDEAVVSVALAQSKGTFELIDLSPLLPGLISSPGMTAWTLTSRDLSTVLHNYDEAKAFTEASTDRRSFQYSPSMFPDAELLAQQHIERTFRVLPHAQDTGGFFVAALRCVSPVPEDARGATPTTTSAAQEGSSEGAGDAPIKPISAKLRASVQHALALPDSFPFDRLVVRNEEARDQKIYLANADTIAMSQKLGSRVVHVGAKVFESVVRYSNDNLRFCADGVAELVPFLPASFIVPVEPSLLLEMADEVPMMYNEFAAKTDRTTADLPPSFVLTTSWATVGPIYVVAEKSVKLGKIVAKVKPWHVTMCKLALKMPLVEETEEAEEENGDGDDDSQQAAKQVATEAT